MKRLILFITFLLSINFIYAQKRVTDTNRLIVRDSINLNGDEIYLDSPSDGQFIQRVYGKWVNASVSTTGWDSITFNPDDGLLRAYSGAVVDYSTSLDNRYIQISDSTDGYITPERFLDTLANINNMIEKTVYEITLPSSTTVAGRIAGAVEGTDYPNGWVLTAGTSPVDLIIQHDLGSRRAVNVTVWAVDGTYEQQLFNTAAYNGIRGRYEANQYLWIQSLATIQKPIKIYIIFN